MPSLRAIRDAAADGYKNRYFARGVTTLNSNLTVVVDSDRQEPAGEWERVDTFIQFQGGALDGIQKRVTGYSPGNSLTIAAAVAASIAAGMSYALYKTFNVEKWNRAINETLMDMAPDRMIQTYATLTEFNDPLAGGPSYRMQIPTLASQDARIVRIDRQKYTDGTPLGAVVYQELYEGLDYDLFHQDNGAGQLLFMRLRYIPGNSNLIRVHYEKRLASLTLDTDITFEPLDQLLYGARSHIAAMEGDKQQSEYWANKFQLAAGKFPIDEDERTNERPRIIVR